ncbi:MAG: hypothetical protein KKB20_01875 [Proteobacteria bacterium]|nr:hypothetical protein [Pseudomonadota bacterium]
MKLKPVVLIIGILILAQILIYANIERGNVSRIEVAISGLDPQIRESESTRLDLVKQLNRLKKIVEDIPPRLLAGFEDPEIGFVEFLDYLQSPFMKEVNAQARLGAKSFKQSPIPYHESNFEITFEYTNTVDAERFLNSLLFQERYPLQVKRLDIRRKSQGVVGATLSVSLAIPARLKFPGLVSQAKAVAK